MTDGITFEEYADAPELLHARALLAAGDAGRFRAVYEPLDWRGRSLLTGVAVTEDPALEPVLADLAARLPGDPMIGVLRAWHLVVRGWAVRTGRRARDVTPEQFAGFRAYLCRAEELLIELTARYPGHVSAWECRIVTAKGLGLGLPEARRRYEGAMRAGPLSYTAQVQLLGTLAPKWGGSWEAYHAHARECFAAAPPGSMNATILAEAHLDHWHDLDPDEAAGYVDRPGVRAELRESADRSVWHPAYRDAHWTWIGVRNQFAFLFYLLDERQAAAAQFTALGRFGVTEPWDALAGRGETGEDVFRRARQWALGPARR